MKEYRDETEQTKKPTWLDYVAEGCGELIVQLTLLGICFFNWECLFCLCCFWRRCTIFDFTFCDVSLFYSEKICEKAKAKLSKSSAE